MRYLEMEKAQITFTEDGADLQPPAQTSDRHIPCPFCGCQELLLGDWYIDDEQVDALECTSCKAGAPIGVWNKRAGVTFDAAVWTWPKGDKGWPTGEQSVYAFYKGADGHAVGPVVMKPMDKLGRYNKMYWPLLCWHPLPDLPDLSGV